MTTTQAPILPAALSLSITAKWFDASDETHHFKIRLSNAENGKHMDLDFSGGCLAFAPKDDPTKPNRNAAIAQARKAIAAGKRMLDTEARYKAALAVLHTHAQPDLASVLYSIQSDAQFGEDTFADFCANYGYDEDSRKAFGIYEACQKQGTEYKRTVPAPMRDLISEALKDY